MIVWLPSAGRFEDFGGDYVALSGADVGELTKEIDAWREAGGTHVTVVTMGLGLDSVGRHIDYLADLAGRLDIGSSAAR